MTAHLPPRVSAAGDETGAEDLQEGRVAELEILRVVLQVAGHDALHHGWIRDDDAVSSEDLHAHGLRRGGGCPSREEIPRARIVADRLEERDRVPDEGKIPRRHRSVAQHERLAVPSENRSDSAEHESQECVDDRGRHEDDGDGGGDRLHVELRRGLRHREPRGTEC